MSNIVQSPNMSLPVPVVGAELGPQYATDVNNCMGLIDSHNHSFGQGVQITPDGLNINSDLTIQENNLTNIRASRFNSQLTTIPSTAPDINEVYVTAGDLYFNDGFNNIVRLTQGGSVAGSQGSISGLTSPASASYNPGTSTFIWQSGANTSAAMDNGPITIRNIVANSPGITIEAPNALVTPYTLTLPVSLPGSTQYLTVDNLGNVSTQAIPGPNYVVSASSGLFSTSSIAQVTNMQVVITTTGGPVEIKFLPQANVSGQVSGVGGTGSTSSVGGTFQIYQGPSFTTLLSQVNVLSSVFGSTGTTISVGPSNLNFIDYSVVGVPGTYTYTLFASTTSQIFANYIIMTAQEIK